MVVVRRSLAENEETIQRATDREQDAHPRREAARRGELMKANDAADVRKRIMRVSDAEQVTVAALAPEEAAAAPETIAAIAQLAQERVMGSNDMVSVAYLELAMAAARSVCRVKLRSSSGHVLGYGSGFMVSPTLMLTNHHVLLDATLARHALAEFDYQDGGEGLPLEPRLFALEPDRFFENDKSLDWALVSVSARSHDGVDLSEFGWLPLIGQTGKAANGEAVNLIQHPEGGPKQLALRENRLIERLEKYLHYESDTARGSSGAPVFNDQWEVVALHHAAYPRIENGQVMSKAGVPWRAEMGDDAVDWRGNEGIRVSVLVAALTDAVKRLGGERRSLLQALLDGQRSPWPPFHRRGKPWPSSGGAKAAESSASGGAAGAGAPVIGADGAVTWTLPVSVTVRLGGSAPVAAVPVAPATQQQQTKVAAPPITPDRGSEAFERYRKLHEDASSRTYYDAASDAAAQVAYYRDIDLNDPDIESLRATLSGLLDSTHERELPYKPLEYVYPSVDKRRDGTLRSIYSGKSFSAEEIIRADLEVDRILATASEALRVTGGSEALDVLEASFPYNCEHVVPQSWFGKANPQRGDLHHLFTCESGCNSFRGNIAYWDFPDFEEAIRDLCGKREPERFEPSAGKAAIARATLYFMLRYPGTISNRYDEERLKMLVSWSNSKKVDDWERHRNAEIQKLQGNRNPFIDHAGLAERFFGR